MDDFVKELQLIIAMNDYQIEVSLWCLIFQDSVLNGESTVMFNWLVLAVRTNEITIKSYVDSIKTLIRTFQIHRFRTATFVKKGQR